jgi:hypothetical protein
MPPQDKVARQEQIYQPILSPASIPSMQDAKESRPTWLKVVNWLITTLVGLLIAGCIGASIYFFNRGGNSIWMIVLIAVWGGGALAFLIVLSAIINGLHSLIKKTQIVNFLPKNSKIVHIEARIIVHNQPLNLCFYSCHPQVVHKTAQTKEFAIHG